MKIPEGFTPRGDSNEQPLETYDKNVQLVFEGSSAEHIPAVFPANIMPWKIPDGPMRIIAWRLAP